MKHAAILRRWALAIPLAALALPAAAQEPIRIGAIYSISGPGSFLGAPEDRALLAATDVGMELMAAAGFLEQEVMQRYFRDARLHVFAPVNNEMVLNLLAERWLDLPRSY